MPPAFVRRLGPAAVILLAAAATAPAAPATDPMNAIAESYVKLTLAAGVHDADCVDAYHGPVEWRAEAEAAQRPLAEVGGQVGALRARLAAVDPAGWPEIERLRHEYLTKQLRALATRLEIVGGRRFRFDEESALLFDAVAPTHTEEHFRGVIAQLDAALPPGPGTVAERLERFRRDFVIPPARLAAVFDTAIAAGRERTARHIPLPPGESFTVEYVTDKPWSGYNWYQGGYRSVIQVNTDLPIFIDRAVDLACHEGYPGHHLYNALLEQQLYRGRGWVEFSIYPLFSPQSLIAEGTANFGIDVAFSEAERKAYVRDVLFPLAGLDPARAEAYERIGALAEQLDFAGNEAARRYLDGAIDAAAATDWLVRYALQEPKRAAQKVRFIDKYRSYVINYNHGEELVRRYFAARDGGDPERRWQLFRELISSPRLPSGLQ